MPDVALKVGCVDARTRESHSRYLEITLEEAAAARAEGLLPVGSVIVGPDGSTIARGHNRVITTGDQTAHAEIEAIRAAGATIRPTPHGPITRLYTSAEPCLMCLGAILQCQIGSIIWAADSVIGGAYGALLTTEHSRERLSTLEVVREPSSDHRTRSRAMLRHFYERQGNLERAQWLAD